MNTRLVLALASLLLFSACGGGSDPKALNDAGAKALNSGDYSAAAESFDSAVAALGDDTSNPEWLKAKLGAIQARTQTDAARAKDEFLQLAQANPSKVTDQHFSMVGSRLGDAKHLPEAIAVLKEGQKMHAESPHLQSLLEELGKKAEAGEDPEALKQLEGLGYASGK
jgi:hypothetical protein